VVLDSCKQKIIVIAETNKSVAARITEELQNNGFYNFKFAINGSEVFKITRDHYENPEEINLVIINEDLPDCQVNELSKSFSDEEGGIFIPLIVLKKDSDLECDDLIVDSRHLIYHLKNDYSSIELLTVVKFFILLRNEKYLRYKQKEILLTELAERKLVDARIQYLVIHDELTGLLNRSSLEQHIQLTMSRNSSRNFSLDSALLFIDLDRFSLLNELEGFDVGDRLLIEVICLIRKTLDNVGVFARIDSDKFGLFLANCSIIQAETWSRKILTALDNFRFIIGTIAYNITASIGLSSLNSAKTMLHPRELISQAHQACCMAKNYGRNTLWRYDSEDTVVRERHRDIYWVPIIREALINDRFFLVFQPIVKLSDGEVSHYEVLIRLKNEAGLVIAPVEFIPAAERMGLIHGIDLWVVEKAIDYLATLPVGMAHISLAINLSSVAFQDLSLLPMIKQKLEMTGVRAERLTFEITETAAVENYKQTRLMINQIRGLGCRFALDDFGAGFCSFNYLKTFPVDYVKIDGQFITNLINDETDQMLVRSMHQIANKLGKKTIAEYVECTKTINLLREIGVNYGQGYIFGKPSESLLPQNLFQIGEVF
jgi:diguanylate cyclase (GGDEF)-like protein